LRSDSFIEGLQAIDWTVEERGLAGLSDLEGIPWTMPMEQFFEAWVETVMRCVARSVGGILKTGRQRETVAALAWSPPYLGSQRSLVPDMILELDQTSFIGLSLMRSTNVTGKNSRRVCGTARAVPYVSDIERTFCRHWHMRTLRERPTSCAASSTLVPKPPGNLWQDATGYSTNPSYQTKDVAFESG
jgi:hypothetical protein